MKKREYKEKKSNSKDFYYLIGNRAKVIGESQKSVKFLNTITNKKGDAVFYEMWLPKKLVFKNEYSLMLTICIPKDWDEYNISSPTTNEDLTLESLDELKEYMGFKEKVKAKKNKRKDKEDDEEDEDEE